MVSRKNRRGRPRSTRGPNPFVLPIIGIVLLILGLAVALGAFGYAGTIGEIIFDGLKLVLGFGISVLLGLGMILQGLSLIFRRKLYRLGGLRIVFYILASLSLLGVVAIFSKNSPVAGGSIGQWVAGQMHTSVGTILGVLILSLVFLGCIYALFHGEIKSILRTFGILSDTEKKRVRVVTDDGVEEVDIEERTSKEKDPHSDTPPQKNQQQEPRVKTMQVPEGDLEAAALGIPVHSFSQSYHNYSYPPLSLLEKTTGKPNVGDLKENARIIQRTLANFHIEVETDEITVGPTITRYAIKPAAGIKLSSISNLQSNLELALAAHPLRIEAPIPGKSLVGIEVPNKKKVTVTLGQMLSDSEFRNSNKPLLVSLGKDVSGKSIFSDLAKMPHVLIAGATGSGKSVTVHNMITSLLYRNSPETLRMIMIDPKRVELTHYNGIPHLLTPVIKNAKKAIMALKWATNEMDRRYDILETNGTQNIVSYHKKIAPIYEASADDDSMELPERMPYIAIFIDELADLMTLYPKELEGSIVRLAQMSRAVGLHLILSTQRPSKQIVTGLIKANIPTRVALKVASNIDSRVILDSGGAEDLLGQGDMLFLGSDSPKPVRVQCAYISEEEMKRVVKHITSNNDDIILDRIDIPEDALDQGQVREGGSGDEEDELFEEAREIVVRARKGSTSLLQRKLRVGYSRAARLMDLLEDAGIVGPPDGSKPREVYEQSKADEMAEYGDEYDEDEEIQR